MGQWNKSGPADVCLPSQSPKRLWVIEQISNRKPISHRHTHTPLKCYTAPHTHSCCSLTSQNNTSLYNITPSGVWRYIVHVDCVMLLKQSINITHLYSDWGTYLLNEGWFLQFGRTRLTASSCFQSLCRAKRSGSWLWDRQENWVRAHLKDPFKSIPSVTRALPVHRSTTNNVRWLCFTELQVSQYCKPK